MNAIRAETARTFEGEMVRHLAAFSPPLFKAIGEPQLREAIRFGVAAADRHGFTTRGPVRLYLELMLLFGSRFDTDPQYPWAQEILNERDSAPQAQRADVLYRRTLHFLEKVNGPNDTHTLAALRRIRSFAARPLPTATDGFARSMFDEVCRIHPQKAAYLGVAPLQALILEGGRGARSFGFSSPRAFTLMIALMLAFGHGCTDDPLYPWISRTLRDPAIADPEARAGRLERKSLTWLDHVLAYFDGPAPP
jgi:hypothetical protein